MDTEITNPAEFINGIKEFSGNKLKDEALMLEIVQSCVNSGNTVLLSEISFNAKYINGLMRVMKSAQGRTDVQNLDAIKSDLSSGFEKFVGQINEISALLPETVSAGLNDTYLQMTHDSFLRLNELIADMEWVKMYLNSLKRK